MMTYQELKKALEQKKDEIYGNIAAVLIQSEEPLSAKEVGQMLQLTTQEASGLMTAGVHELYSKSFQLGYEVKSCKKMVYKKYVNINDPTDIITIGRDTKKYWAESLEYFK